MKRFLLATLLAVVMLKGLHLVAEATQNRPDAVTPGSRTIIEYSVSTQEFQRGAAAAAATLWGVCAATVAGDVSSQPTALGDRWTVSVSPRLGEHGEKRLVGCLEDATVDRVSGHVVDLRHA